MHSILLYDLSLSDFTFPPLQYQKKSIPLGKLVTIILFYLRLLTWLGSFLALSGLCDPQGQRRLFDSLRQLVRSPES